MPKYIDQMNNAVSLNKVDSIISLVPSQTELLYQLGLEDKVVGITKFCIKPDSWFKSKTRIGGTKTLNLELINQIKPDLIIGNKEENSQSDIEALIESGHSVWMSDIYSDRDNLEMIEQVGVLTNTESKAGKMISEFKQRLIDFTKSNIRVAYFIWKDPYFIVGNNNYIDFNLNKIGLINCAKQLSRYEEISIENIRLLEADFLLFSSEPFPFSNKHMEELESIFGKNKCKIVDGEMFSWTGYRPILALDYFKFFLEELTSVDNKT